MKYVKNINEILNNPKFRELYKNFINLKNPTNYYALVSYITD
jgi:hypothetical protein